MTKAINKHIETFKNNLVALEFVQTSLNLVFTADENLNKELTSILRHL